MTATEHSAPTSWTTSDERFFKVVEGLFPPALLEGASVLLASYDTDVDTVVAAGSAPTTSAALDPTPQPAPAYAVVRSGTRRSDLS